MGLSVGAAEDDKVGTIEAVVGVLHEYAEGVVGKAEGDEGWDDGESVDVELDVVDGTIVGAVGSGTGPIIVLMK